MIPSLLRDSKAFEVDIDEFLPLMNSYNDPGQDPRFSEFDASISRCSSPHGDLSSMQHLSNRMVDG
jgi:hypothetical protein